MMINAVNSQKGFNILIKVKNIPEDEIRGIVTDNIGAFNKQDIIIYKSPNEGEYTVFGVIIPLDSTNSAGFSTVIRELILAELDYKPKKEYQG
jgi:hypothetical protein